jgi:hypothetical protein
MTPEQYLSFWRAIMLACCLIGATVIVELMVVIWLLARAR